jgi:hypothetical protein
MVTVHLRGEVPDAVFDACIRAHYDDKVRGELVYTSGNASLGPLQRKALIAYATSTRDYRAAVIITSALPRGVATALSWFYDGLKVFRPDQIDEACGFLAMSPTDREWARATVRELIQADESPSPRT